MDVTLLGVVVSDSSKLLQYDCAVMLMPPPPQYDIDPQFFLKVNLLSPDILHINLYVSYLTAAYDNSYSG